MVEKIKKIILELISNGKTIATMESCTGGAVVNEITNIERASEVLKFSAVTYSNEFKIKMGVPEEVIEKYTVYSKETAREMSKKISIFADSNFGIGVTGKLCRADRNNLQGEDNKVYVCIYERDINQFNEFEVIVTKEERWENKEDIINKIMDKMQEILKI